VKAIGTALAFRMLWPLARSLTMVLWSIETRAAGFAPPPSP